MGNQFLLMWFEAPLQSWGFDSKFSRRDTQKFPTKSGILGLLCCALGAGGEQRELLAKMAPLSTTVISYVKQENEESSSTFLVDFQMIGAGYDDKNSWETLHIPKKSDGKKATGGGTKLTHRYYLQDSAFGVILEVPRSEAQNFSGALRNPVWDLYLGRKNCVPTEFIYQGLYESSDEALAVASDLAIKKGRTEKFKVLDGKHLGEVILRNDVPIQFGENKSYQSRYITIVTP